jgi:hypothetical protein
VPTTGVRMQTFVLRVWVEPAEGRNAPGTLHGVVEHVGSGGSTTFTDDGELLTYLQEATGQAGQAGDAR